jgi:hypothetical protein
MKEQPTHLGQAAILYGPPVPDQVSDVLLLAVLLIGILALICAIQLGRCSKAGNRSDLR